MEKHASLSLKTLGKLEESQIRNLHEELFRKCKKGDEKAQYRLYKMYSKVLYNLILRMLGNSLDAEDVLQDTFVTAFDQISALKDSRAMSAWLKKIAVNKSLEFLRRKKIEFIEIETDIPASEELEYSQIPMEVIHHQIKLLPEGCRVIFTLYLLEDYSHKEIAQLLKISESTSKSQYKRAKHLLKQELKEQHYGG